MREARKIRPRVLLFLISIVAAVWTGPAHAAGPFVLVTEWGEFGGAGIAKIDPATDTITARAPHAGSPRHITADAARRVAYVSLHYGNKVAAVMPDTLEMADLDIAGLGKAPIGVTLTPDGGTLLVATRGDDGVPSSDDRLDIVSLDFSAWPPKASLVKSIPTGLHPIQAIVDRSGRYAVVTVRNQPAILVLDLATYQVVWQAPGLPPDAEPEGGAAHPAQDIVYVTLHGKSTIEVIDLAAMRITRHVPITNSTGAPTQPSAVTFTPDGARAYVSGQTVDRILMFDTSDPQNPIQDSGIELLVGRQPHEIVWLPGDRGYVANTNNMQPAGSLSVIHDYKGTPSATGPILTDLAGPLSFTFFEELPTPLLESLSCDSGVPGDIILLSGGPFGMYQGTSNVTVNGLPAAVDSWSDTSIAIVLPAGFTPGPVIVQVRGEPTNGLALAAGSPAPAAVTGVKAVKAGAEVALSWQEVTATACGTLAHLDHYRVYRGTSAAAIGSLAGTSATAFYMTTADDVADPADFYYSVRAVDATGQEGQ